MFNKDSGLRSASLLKKTLQQRCFPVNFVKFCWTSRRLLLFVIYLTVSFWKEVLYICWNLLLLEKSTKTDNFTIFSFSKYILYCESIYTIDQNINVRNHVSLMRYSNCIYKTMCWTVITNVNYRIWENIYKNGKKISRKKMKKWQIENSEKSEISEKLFPSFQI